MSGLNSVIEQSTFLSSGYIEKPIAKMHKVPQMNMQMITNSLSMLSALSISCPAYLSLAA
jgi:hypothetical protein